MATKTRNNLVELARFLFSLLVVGYHIQMTWAGDGLQFFAGGALAVEFFFLVSGYFLARSIEKINATEQYKLLPETGRFMWGKIKSILPVHIVAVIAVIVVILSTKLGESGDILVKGIPSIFLVQMAVVWDGSFANALIVPEWYLSAMLITMLFMVPIALLLRKKIKGVFTTLVLVGLIIVALVICGLATQWAMPQNFVYDLRAWGEMCVGMFAYYLATFIGKKELKQSANKALPIIEIVLYSIPLILGFIPFPADYAYITMIVAVVCVFGAITITFSDKGLQIKNARLNAVFGYFGGISLAIYLFHPVLISIFEYGQIGLPFWAYHLIIFSTTLCAAILYDIAKRAFAKGYAKFKAPKRTV